MLQLENRIEEPDQILAPDFRESEEWEDCKAALKNKIPAPFYNSFIQPIEVLGNAFSSEDSGNGKSLTGREKSELFLCVPDEKTLRHIEARYFSIIQETLKDSSFQGQVSLITRKPGERQPATPQSAPQPARPQTRSATPSRFGQNVNLPAYYPHPDNAPQIQALFENRLPGVVILLRGCSGAGKTTLARNLLADQNHTLSSDPSIISSNPPNSSSHITGEQNARYMTLETFVTEFSIACREKEVIRWRNRLRNHHLLIIDDFQFIKKTALKTQEELRHILDDFEEQGKRLVLISDTEFKKLPLQEDLFSRLHTGVTLELKTPDQAGREKILTGELHALQVSLSPDEIAYVARKISTDMRKLKSVALRLLQEKRRLNEGEENALAREPVSNSEQQRARLDNLLGDLFCRHTGPAPEKILEKVADFFQLHPSVITGPARDKKFVLARHLTAFLCSEILEMKLSDIAALVGRKEHGSVIHARKKITEMMQTDLYFEEQVKSLARDVGGRLESSGAGV